MHAWLLQACMLYVSVQNKLIPSTPSDVTVNRQQRQVRFGKGICIHEEVIVIGEEYVDIQTWMIIGKIGETFHLQKVEREDKKNTEK